MLAHQLIELGFFVRILNQIHSIEEWLLFIYAYFLFSFQFVAQENKTTLNEAEMYFLVYNFLLLFVYDFFFSCYLHVCVESFLDKNTGRWSVSLLLQTKHTHIYFYINYTL